MSLFQKSPTQSMDVVLYLCIIIWALATLAGMENAQLLW